MKKILINGKEISGGSPVYFVGEMGINHNGSLEIVKKLIDMAKACGLDAIKLQKRTPDLCVPEKQKNVLKETPWGDMTYLEYKKKMEFGLGEYREINHYCKEKGIVWFASVWYIQSVDFLEKFNVPCYKVPSPQLTNKDLLLRLRELGKPVFLSTGMSTEEEIKKAVKVFGCDYPLAILHCVSNYPAKDEELNLSYIQELMTMFPEYIIGYSGHEKGIAASLVAATLGAKIIEKHITLDRTMWGTDHAASLEFPGIRRLSRDLKKLNLWLGNGTKKITKNELEIKKRLRNVHSL